MTRLLRPNGTALLTLVVALLVATWPFFGTFTIGTLIGGLLLSLSMRSWHTEHPTTVAVPDGYVSLNRNGRPLLSSSTPSPSLSTNPASASSLRPLATS